MAPASTPKMFPGGQNVTQGGNEKSRQPMPTFAYRERLEELKQRILDLSKRNEEITLRIIREWMQEPKSKP